jgi:hypothetical protein
VSACVILHHRPNRCYRWRIHGEWFLQPSVILFYHGMYSSNRQILFTLETARAVTVYLIAKVTNVTKNVMHSTFMYTY